MLLKTAVVLAMADKAIWLFFMLRYSQFTTLDDVAYTNVKVFEVMPPVVKTEMTNELEGIPKMSFEQHAQLFIKGFLNDRLGITPGISLGLKVMSHIAPKLTFNLLNR